MLVQWCSLRVEASPFSQGHAGKRWVRSGWDEWDGSGGDSMRVDGEAEAGDRGVTSRRLRSVQLMDWVGQTLSSFSIGLGMRRECICSH